MDLYLQLKKKAKKKPKAPPNASHLGKPQPPNSNRSGSFLANSINKFGANFGLNAAQNLKIRSDEGSDGAKLCNGAVEQLGLVLGWVTLTPISPQSENMWLIF